MGDKNLGTEITDPELEAFKKNTIEMLNKWTPREFAEQLYGNRFLGNESRFILQHYLSEHPQVQSEVQKLREEYFPPDRHAC